MKELSPNCYANAELSKWFDLTVMVSSPTIRLIWTAQINLKLAFPRDIAIIPVPLIQS